LRFRSPPPQVTAAHPGRDLCGATRPQSAAAGAFDDFAVCLRAGVR
jgi:hypothetical protein